MRTAKRYTLPDRLGDVLALLQVLALDPYAHRSEKGLQGELQGPPRSAATWKSLAQEHPEFFRVCDDEKNPISLVARHVTPAGDGPIGRSLDVAIIGKFLSAAIDLHDRELSRGAVWRAAWPTLVAVVLGGVLTTAGTYLNSRFQLGNQRTMQRVQQQTNLYSRLAGRKFVTSQLYLSWSEALLYSDYYEARWKNGSSQKDSLDQEEGLRWRRRAEDLVSDILKSNQSLFEDLGELQIAFGDSAELRAALAPLWNIKPLPRTPPPRGADASALENWQADTLRQLKGAALAGIENPFDGILRFINEHRES